MPQVKGIPDNSSVVMPRLVCRDVAAEIDFCANVFDAVELGSRPGPDGKPAHALLTIGPAMIMIEAESPTLTSRAPALDGTSPVVIFVYVENVDETVERAVARGAKSARAGAEPVLGRSQRVDHGSLRPRLDDRDAHRDHVGRRAATAMVAHSPTVALINN